jgi:hypothetical protein
MNDYLNIWFTWEVSFKYKKDDWLPSTILSRQYLAPLICPWNEAKIIGICHEWRGKSYDKNSFFEVYKGGMNRTPEMLLLRHEASEIRGESLFYYHSDTAIEIKKDESVSCYLNGGGRSPTFSLLIQAPRRNESRNL